MRCPHCRHSLDVGEVKCAWCGWVVQEDKARHTAVRLTRAKWRRRIRKFLWMLLIAALVGLAAWVFSHFANRLTIHDMF